MQRSGSTVIESARAHSRGRGRRTRARITAQASIPTMVCQARSVDYRTQGCCMGRALLPQRLHSRHDPQPVPDGVNAHLLQRCLIQLQQNVSPYVIGPEDRRVVRAADARKPAGDVGIRPCSQIVGKRHSWRWVQGHVGEHGGGCAGLRLAVGIACTTHVERW